MKVLKLFAFLLVSTSALFSCQKDEVVHPTDTIEGIWEGNYGYGSDDPDIYFSLNIKPGGIIEELNRDGDVKGTGTWQLEGDYLTATYTWFPPLVSTYTIEANFNKSTGKLDGFWGYANGEAVGEWYMYKKN